MKSTKHIVIFFLAILSGVALERRVIYAQILPADRCPNAPSTSSDVAQARYQWGLWCRDHPLSSPGGTPYTADHYLNMSSMINYDNNPDLQPFLYPTFYNQHTFSGFDLSNVPGTDCTALPTSAFNVGLCLACNTDLIATSPGGVVSRSGSYDSTYEAWQAFDSNNSTMWISGMFQTPAWIAYQWTDGPRTVTRYAIDFVNGSLTSRAPRDWTFEGWNGSSWNVIDTRSAQTGWLGVERREYAVTSPGSYSTYRLNISDDNDDRAGVVVVSMGKVELIGCPPPPPPPCGDGICSFGESSLSCPQDCGRGGGCLIEPCSIE